MQLFYSTDIRGDFAYLDEEEAKHCIQVLRKAPGDTLHLVDGQGGFYTTTLLEGNKRACTLQIVERQLEYGKRPYQIHLAIAPTKNINRFEFFLEKATELGVDRIIPLNCHYSERRNLRIDRLEKKLIAAMKQSLQAYCPSLEPMQDFDDFLAIQQFSDSHIGCLAYCGPADKIHLQNNYQAGQDVTILIGPEGDFSEEEVAAFLEKGGHLVHLGDRRLRTETAGIIACHTIHLCNER